MKYFLLVSCWVGILFSFCTANSYANKIRFSEITGGVNVESHLEVYTGKIKDPSVLEQESELYFKPYNWDSIPAGRSETWIRLKIDNTDGSEHKLVIGNNQFDYLEFYEKQEDETYKVKLSGTLCDHNLMEIVFGANSWFSFYVPSNKVTTYFIRATNIDKVKYQYSRLPFTAYGFKEFKSYQNTQNFFNYFFWGGILIITLYNFVLYFQLRSKIYLYYVFNNLVILVFVLSQAGVLSELCFKNSRYHEHLLLVLGNLAFIFYLLFCKEFLELKNTRPKLDALLNKVLLVWPLPLILIWFNQSAIAVAIGGLVALWGYTMIMISAYRQIKKGNVGARYFFIANWFYYAGIIVSILQIGNVLPSSILGLSAVNFVELGTLLQLSLFSLTVGFRIVKMQNEIIEKQLEQEKIKSEEEQKRRLLIEKQNKELEQKVSERTQELADTNEELMRQSEVLEQQVFLVEQKQKEIIDSITYAKRIQYTLLAHSELLKKHLPDYFIFFKPKDIVSGDFYWATQKNNKFYFAVCDSTGHGVPGAFMSLLNISFLNEAINEKGLVEPNHILDYVRDRLTGSVSQDGAKDGMDGTLLCFDILTKEIAYASAYNKPVLVRNNQFVELQSDKMPIGMGEKLEPFNKFILEVIPGDHVFFYTDGFADQFGGPKGKKFKYKALNELLAGNVTKSLDVQKQLLFEAFYKWKNNEEQVDDVCVVGLKF